MITLGTNGYVSVADFKAWADARRYDYFSFTDAEIEAAIVISSVDFIDTNYTFKGVAVDEAQAMQLPTDDVAIADIVNAASQSAWLQLQGKLFVADSEQTTASIESESASVGSISESKTYRGNYTREYTYNTSKIDRLLSKYVVGGSAGGIGLLRA